MRVFFLRSYTAHSKIQSDFAKFVYCPISGLITGLAIGGEWHGAVDCPGLKEHQSKTILLLKEFCTFTEKARESNAECRKQTDGLIQQK